MIRYLTLFLVLFSGTGLVFWELALRSSSAGLNQRMMACLGTGMPEHHFFRPACRAVVEAPGGGVDYHINEDGFRAAPRAEYSGRDALVLLGDSKVEGWWLAEKDTLAALLDASGVFPGKKSLNLGIRFSGPSIQRLRLHRALEKYRVGAVLWFLNGTDPSDEYLAQSLALARDEFGAPEALSIADLHTPGWLDWLQAATGRRSALLSALQLRLYDREVIRRVREEASSARHCSAFRSAAALLRSRGIPLFPVLLPVGPNAGKFPYMNLVSNEEGSELMAECVRDEGLFPLDLRTVLGGDPSLYWENHRNMNAAGVRQLAAHLIWEPAFRAPGVRASHLGSL